jgi:hypothetical protein
MISKIKNIFAKYFITTFQMKEIMVENYLNENLYKNPKYQDPKKLNLHEFQVFSQNGEDGIIEEIFNRIGTTDKFFIEFGIQDGIETNCTYLLWKSWKGLWLEGSEKYVQMASKTFADEIQKQQLRIQTAFLTAENIEDLFKKYEVPKEFDLISIDIDGNDYYVWEAMKNYAPRVVVIEYNSMIPPSLGWVKSYRADETWNGTNHFNAGLKAHEILAEKKGYKLVGCNFSGCNAFFVREDLINDKFAAPYTSENHYEPARYYLVKTNGKKRGFGKYNIINR